MEATPTNRRRADTPVQIGAQPDSGFDNPLGMLQDCHRRIETFLQVLVRVAGRTPNTALPSEQADAVRRALEYFRVGGQRHNQDEEDSLFPRLRTAGVQGFESIDRLETDHRSAGEDHTVVNRLFSAWIASGAIAANDHQTLASATRRLQDLYAEHIRLEETTIFPHAARLLDSSAIREMGAEFRARRNEPQ
jgi:iron-sulfur cluster repair protein YtfE (RIC family)